jgi:hypothetical protein
MLVRLRSSSMLRPSKPLARNCGVALMTMAAEARRRGQCFELRCARVAQSEPIGSPALWEHEMTVWQCTLVRSVVRVVTMRASADNV